MPRKNPVQLGPRAGAFKLRLGKISNLYSPHSIAHRMPSLDTTQGDVIDSGQDLPEG